MARTMALIEGVGDEVTLLFSLVFIMMVLALAWASTRTVDRGEQNLQPTQSTSTDSTEQSDSACPSCQGGSPQPEAGTPEHNTEQQRNGAEGERDGAVRETEGVRRRVTRSDKLWLNVRRSLRPPVLLRTRFLTMCL